MKRRSLVKCENGSCLLVSLKVDRVGLVVVVKESHVSLSE